MPRSRARCRSARRPRRAPSPPRLLHRRRSRHRASPRSALFPCVFVQSEGSARAYLQPAGSIVRRAAERILPGRCPIERNDPGGIGGDQWGAAPLARTLEVVARHTIERGAVEDDRMRAAVARGEANYVALAGLYGGRLEFAAVPPRDVDLLQGDTSGQPDRVVRELEHSRPLLALRRRAVTA